MANTHGRREIGTLAWLGACRQHDAQQWVQQHMMPTANVMMAAAATPRKANSARNAHAGACGPAARGSALCRPGAGFALPDSSDGCRLCSLAASGATPCSGFAAGPGPCAPPLLIFSRAAAWSAGAGASSGAGNTAGAGTTAGADPGLNSCTPPGSKPGPGPRYEARRNLLLQHVAAMRWTDCRRRDKGVNKDSGCTND